MFYLLILITAYSVTFLVTPFIRAFALKLALIDKKAMRKVHNKVITRFGGLAIYAGFIFSIFLIYIFNLVVNSEYVSSVKLIIFSSSLILFLGLYDDVKGANATIKFSIQLLASIVIVYGGGAIREISNPFGQPIELGFMGIPLTILWLVGITNAINLIDGLDGLATGISFLVCMGLFCMFIMSKSLIAAFLTIALAGSCLGFLRYNFFPAKIFMGDTGSLFLGFTIATVSILNHKVGSSTMLLTPIICLGIPILDTSLAFFRRLFHRKNPFKADDKHIHHFLLKMKFTDKKTVFILWGITALLNLFGCWIYYLNVKM